ncbi:hypothetical protein [Tessaracoccus sp.]
MAVFTNPAVGIITVDGPVADMYRLDEQKALGWVEIPDSELDAPEPDEGQPIDPPAADPAPEVPADPATDAPKGKKGVSSDG